MILQKWLITWLHERYLVKYSLCVTDDRSLGKGRCIPMGENDTTEKETLIQSLARSGRWNGKAGTVIH
jgi:hypothetical protein